ncbi:DNA-directed DNA polymerase II small subunit [Candidatus Marsarchaeota archaeon]|nr:DNA-directed DNA polymerase II small subunit [Candidatus Marsarchaeota archaeon]
MAESKLVSELASRLVGVAIISSDIADSDVSGQDIEALIAHITEHFTESERPALLTRDMLLKIMSRGREVEQPIKVDVVMPLDFRPRAREVKADYLVRSVEVEKTVGSVSDFAEHFNDRLSRLKSMIYEGQNNKMAGMIHGIDSLRQYAAGREIAIAGIVYDRRVTKNGNIMVTIEDETGTAKVMFMRPTKDTRNKSAIDLFNNAGKIINDEVMAVRGKISGPFVIANDLIYPDVPIHQAKKVEEDISIAFMSDVHIGSKLFVRKQFDMFLGWINGKQEHRRDVAGKIKYIVVSGDLVDGIGVYPNQERELAIDDIYMQYKEMFTLFSEVPEYIHIFLLTGNHDAVQRAEPQPKLPAEFYKDFKLSNIHLVSNPGYLTLDKVRVLGYHGTSLDSVIQGIPGCSYSKPEVAMLELLKRRHLSPIYGDNPVIPSKRDTMVIDQIPDILHMGHLHKNGYAEYHGTIIVNSGTWQSRTSYQVSKGHIPTPALLPVYDAHNQSMTAVDFNMQFG